MDTKEIITNLKLRRNKYLNPSKEKHSSYFKNLFTRILLSIVVLLIGIIMLKSSDKSKNFLIDNVFTKNLSFAKVSTLYNKYFGSIIPEIPNLNTDTTPVFNEELTYNNIDDYLNGVKLTVTSNYLVPSLKSGIVVFNGEKEGYGNTLIIQGVDGTDIWYGNILNTDYKLYDYVEEGKLLGEVKDTSLYLVFQKDGEYLKFNEYYQKD